MRLETDSQHKTNAQQNEIDRLLVKIRVYEALEEEIDSAVMRAANSSVERAAIRSRDQHQDLEDSNEAMDLSTKALLQTVKGVPFNPERRVKQAVYLAQRLLETEGKVDQLAKSLLEMGEAVKDAKRQEAVAREDLVRSTQPTVYLVNKLRDEETSKSVFLQKCQQLERQLSQSRHTEATCAKENQEMKDRLRNLLQQRGELETIRHMLQTMQAEPESEMGSNNNGAEYEDEYSDESFDMEREEDQQGEMERKAQVSSPSRIRPYPEVASSFQTPAYVKRERDMAELKRTAETFGLSPETLKQMTSPPSSKPIHQVSYTYKRELL